VLKDLASMHPCLRLRLAIEPPFWRETRQFHQRAPEFTNATLEWLAESTND
jgi:hypothetical protein